MVAKTKTQKMESWHDEEGRVEKNSEHLAKMEESAKNGTMPKGGVTITLPHMRLGHITVELVGETPLIVHAWSEKAKKEMLDKHMGVATPGGREFKNPTEDFLQSLYTIKPGVLRGNFEMRTPLGHPDIWLEGGVYGFPAIAVKNAAVTSCTSVGKNTLPKTLAKQMFHVDGESDGALDSGELCIIEGSKPRMREDMVRVGQNKPDIRYRAEFANWRTRVNVHYNMSCVSLEQLLNLFNIAGFAVGLCEWRIEKDGNFGRFHCGSVIQHS
jgi:hypothetical protein